MESVLGRGVECGWCDVLGGCEDLSDLVCNGDQGLRASPEERRGLVVADGHHGVPVGSQDRHHISASLVVPPQNHDLPKGERKEGSELLHRGVDASGIVQLSSSRLVCKDSRSPIACHAKCTRPLQHALASLDGFPSSQEMNQGSGMGKQIFQEISLVSKHATLSGDEICVGLQSSSPSPHNTNQHEILLRG